MTKVKLDHTAYPYIIDTIVSHAAPDALLAFCSTSKQYRGRLAGWLSHSSMTRNGNTGHRLTSKVPGAPTLVPFVPALVTVLDLDDEECWSQHSNKHPTNDATLGAFSSLCVVRRLGIADNTTDDCTCKGRPHWVLPPVTTVVDYVEHSAATAYDESPVHSLGVDTQRYIFHFRWLDTEAVDIEVLPYYFIIMAKGDLLPVDITFVLWPPGGQADIEHAMAVVGNFIQYLADVRKRSDGRSSLALTVVGIERLHLPAPSPQGNANETPVRAFLRQVEHYLGLLSGESKRAQGLQLLDEAKFMEVDEWRASLGDEEDTLARWP